MNEKLDVFYRGDSEKHVQTCFVCVEVTALHVRSDAAFIKVIWEGIFSVKILRETFVVKGEVCISGREREFHMWFLFFNLNIIIFKAPRFSFGGKRVNKLSVFTFFKSVIFRVNGFKGKQ
jgi:hypothetical protein